MITAITEDQRGRMLAKARDQRPAIRRIGPDAWNVLASSGDHEYEVDRYVTWDLADAIDHWQCSCTAGRNGRPCYHVGAVIIQEEEING